MLGVVGYFGVLGCFGIDGEGDLGIDVVDLIFDGTTDGDGGLNGGNDFGLLFGTEGALVGG